MKKAVAMMMGLALLAPAYCIAAEPLAAADLAGCWEMRDTVAEMARHAEDPFYMSSATLCFDDGAPGQLVTRAAEFAGYRNDAGNWVNGGGDGWEVEATYRLADGQLNIENELSVETCHVAVEADVLTLANCIIENRPDHPRIEDTFYDRALK